MRSRAALVTPDMGHKLSISDGLSVGRPGDACVSLVTCEETAAQEASESSRPEPRVPDFGRGREADRAAARVGRHGHRDATLILVAYRHGLRVGELVSLRWDQVDFKEAVLHVNRSKNGTASNHPIGHKEARSLRRVRRDYAPSAHVFVTERAGPMTAANVRKIVGRA